MTPKVLVVDDNLPNLELAVYLLEVDGLDVDQAGSAREARERIALSMPDLVLMDIQMPMTDGLSAALRLKADPLTRHLRIVAFTAYAMKGDEQRMLAAGLDGYLSKPIEPSRFAAQVRAFLK